jgi:hypothetical protein
MRLQLKFLQIQARNACDESASASLALAGAQNVIRQLQNALGNSATNSQQLRESVKVLEQQCFEASQQLKHALQKIAVQSGALETLQCSKTLAHQKKEALRKRIERTTAQKASEDQCALSMQPFPHTFDLKDHVGTICPEARLMLRQLACEGIGTEHMLAVINAVSSALGVTVVGSISARSVSRIVLEGLIEAKMQVAFEIDKVKCK